MLELLIQIAAIPKNTTKNKIPKNTIKRYELYISGFEKMCTLHYAFFFENS